MPFVVVVVVAVAAVVVAVVVGCGGGGGAYKSLSRMSHVTNRRGEEATPYVRKSCPRLLIDTETFHLLRVRSGQRATRNTIDSCKKGTDHTQKSI